MQENETSTLGTVLGCLLLIPPLALLAIGSAVLDGWAISKLWAWFLVPLGVPAITIVHAIGISTLFAFFKARTPPSDKDADWKSLVGTIIGTFLAPLLAVLIGWTAVQFM